MGHAHSLHLQKLFVALVARASLSLGSERGVAPLVAPPAGVGLTGTVTNHGAVGVYVAALGTVAAAHGDPKGRCSPDFGQTPHYIAGVHFHAWHTLKNIGPTSFGSHARIRLHTSRLVVCS